MQNYTVYINGLTDDSEMSGNFPFTIAIIFSWL